MLLAGQAAGKRCVFPCLAETGEHVHCAGGHPALQSWHRELGTTALRGRAGAVLLQGQSHLRIRSA